MASVAGSQNKLFVRAKKTDMDQVGSLLEKLDVPDAEQEESNSPLRVIDISKIDLGTDNSFYNALQMTIGMPFALDRQRKKLIARAPEAGYREILKVVDVLSAPAAAPAKRPPERQIRIVWLVTGEASRKGMAPPDDLRDVLSELAKLGVKNPRLAAQSFVNASAGRQFKSEGTAVIAQGDEVAVTCPLKIIGRVEEGDQETPRLQIEIEALQENHGATQRTLCKLDTTITTPPGHAVVLGMTPTDSMTSIFVVQVLAGKPKQ
jgi:hypothetical protein